MLHQRTFISIGLGAMLSSFSMGAGCAAAIVLSNWSRHNEAQGTIRFVRWSLTLGLLLGILAIEIRDQLLFDACNAREAWLCGFAYLGVCIQVERSINAWTGWRFHRSETDTEKLTQWSIAMLLWYMSLVAILCSLLIYSAAQDRIDWLWFGKFMLIHMLPIFFGVFCCSIWRNAVLFDSSFSTSSSLRKRLVLFSAFVSVVVSVISTAFFIDRFLGRGTSLWIDMSELNFCVSYTIGFMFMFAILLYRTLPQPDKMANTALLQATKT